MHWWMHFWRTDRIWNCFRGKIFEDKYQAWWPDTDVIQRETDEVYNEICKNENLAAVMEELLNFAEKLRRIIWSMTEEGKAQTEEEQEKISLAYVYDREFRRIKSAYLNSKSFSVF